MTENAMWGDAYTVTDNEAARNDDTSSEAYMNVSEPGVVAGVASGHLGRIASGLAPEHKATWLLVVGSIAGLFVFAKLFKSVRA
jgi:hypothetical protein